MSLKQLLAPLVVALLADFGLAATGVFAVADADQPGEQAIRLGDAPQAIQQALRGVDVEEIEVEARDGKSIYEATVQADDVEVELTLTAAGKLLRIEIETGDDEDEPREANEAREEDDDDARQADAKKADQQTVSLDDVPEAARTALRKLAGDAKIEKVEREEDDGVILFEAEWQQNQTTHEATVTADGDLVEQERTVSHASLPQAVRRAVKDRFGDITEVTYERKTVVLYEAESDADGNKREVLLSPSGREVEVEVSDD